MLRKGCSDACILRPCLQWIEGPEAQAHATVFLAKFYGRAGLMGFISAVPEDQRPAVFQSLLYEACGRTISPVYGAVGLLCSGNWNACQAAVESVLKGGAPRPAVSLPEVSKTTNSLPDSSQTSTPRSKLAIKAPEAAPGELAEDTAEPASCCTEAPGSKRPLVVESVAGIADCYLPELKRCRNLQQEVREISSNCADIHQRQSAALIELPEAASMASQVQKHSAGQLVAPIARRLRPREGEAEMGFHAMAAENSENIELGLALHNHLSASMGGARQESASPSTISVNSEGSVTSIRPLSIARTLSLKEERNLLNLLL